MLSIVVPVSLEVSTCAGVTLSGKQLQSNPPLGERVAIADMVSNKANRDISGVLLGKTQLLPLRRRHLTNKSRAEGAVASYRVPAACK